MSYPKWWDKTVTLYNRFENKDGEAKWHRTVLHNCFVKCIPMLIATAGITTVGSQIVIRIRKSSEFMSFDEISFDKIKAYIEDNINSCCFTLQSGDIAVIGEVNDNVNEYISGERPSDFLNKYPQTAFTVKTVTVNDYGNMPHYKITG